MKQLIKIYQLFFLLFLSFLLSSCQQQQKKKYVIGVSQCSTDIWRDKLIQELQTAEYFNDSIDIQFASANDNDNLQVQQIDSFIQKGVDLLIVSPNQQKSLTPVIDKAYDKGIPVILFDRKTSSDKYTAFIGGDNYKIGKTMASYIAHQLHGYGNVVEISGLSGSSPAQDRHRGFTDEIRNYPGIRIVDQVWTDWLERSGYIVMQNILSRHKDIDFVFAQNDRLANGAYNAAKKQNPDNHIMFTGIDGLVSPRGGINQVRRGIFSASYIYPTEGNQVITLAMKILRHQPYQRENLLTSTIITKDNADVLYMQGKEVWRQSNNLETLHNQVDKYFTLANYQKMGLISAIVIIILLITVIVLGYRMVLNRARLHAERAKLKDQQLQFFTNVSHQLRTPLTLIADPIHHIIDRGYLEKDDFDTLRATDRNAGKLMELVENILDFKDAKFDSAGNRIMHEGMIDDSNVPETADTLQEDAFSDSNDNKEDNRQIILVVDDNADIRNYVKSILKEKYLVLTAENGEKGLTIAKEKVPDIIISDIMMPVMDGLEMTRRIKADMGICHIPVLLLTAKSRQEQIAEGFDCGADEYLTKPFNSKVLIARINNMIASQKRIQQKIQESTRLHNSQKYDESNNLNSGNLSEKDNSFLMRLQTIIQNNLGDSNFNVEKIGLEIGLSRIQLYRKVKALTGFPVVELLRMARLAKAKELLDTTDMTVQEVCYNVGFSSPSYFAKCYKDEYGISPSAKK